MPQRDAEKWDAKYALQRATGVPANWLMELLPHLPRGGTGLDLAAGDGANALLLASRGNRMTAVDISGVGLNLGKRTGGPLPVDWVVADLATWEPPAEAFDFVLCFKYFDRERLATIVDTALKPGGLFAAETFQAGSSGSGTGGPTNPDYLLKPNEYRTLFPNYEVLVDTQTGSTACFFARKPSAPSDVD